MSETLLLLILLLVLNISNLILKLSKRIKSCNAFCCKSDCLTTTDNANPISPTTDGSGMNTQLQNMIQETLIQRIMRTLTPRNKNVVSNQQQNDLENPNT